MIDADEACVVVLFTACPRTHSDSTSDSSLPRQLLVMTDVQVVLIFQHAMVILPDSTPDSSKP